MGGYEGGGMKGGGLTFRHSSILQDLKRNDVLSQCFQAELTFTAGEGGDMGCTYIFYA